MAEYWGWDAIAKRIGYSKTTAMTWVKQFGFPVLLRRSPRRKHGPNSVMYTNDELIARWELSMAAKQRRDMLAKSEQRRRMKSVVSAPDPPAATEE